MTDMKKVLIVGVGGGGDTVCAMLRAIDLGGYCDVLGAGYTHRAYLNTLSKYFDDNCNLAQEYLNKVSDYDTDAHGIFEVKNVYHKNVFPETYMTLYEESQFLVAAKSNGLFPGHVYMFESNITHSDKMCDSLTNFVITKGYTEIRVIDFGGDITAPSSLQRDVATLYTMKKVCHYTRIPMYVEIYGLGCDGHAHAYDVRDALMDPSFGAKSIVLDNDCSSFVHLCTSMAESGLSVMKKGRALRAFIDARNVLTRDDFKVFCTENIAPRTEVGAADLYTGHEDDFMELAGLMGCYVEVRPYV